MFVLGVIVGIFTTGITGVFILAWFCNEAYELGRKNEREERD